MRNVSKAEQLRRRAVASAALCAALAAVPALTMTHGHQWVGFACIAVQSILLVFAIHFLAQMKRARRSERE